MVKVSLISTGNVHFFAKNALTCLLTNFLPLTNFL